MIDASFPKLMREAAADYLCSSFSYDTGDLPIDFAKVQSANCPFSHQVDPKQDRPPSFGSEGVRARPILSRVPRNGRPRSGAGDGRITELRAG